MRRVLGWVVGLSLTVTLINGCSPAADDGTRLVACQPLQAIEQPLSLGTVLAIGKLENGTVYVVDQFEDAYRVFQSSGGALMLARQSGSGSSTAADGSEFMSFSYESPVDGTDSTLALNIAGGVVRMAVAATAVPKANFETTLAVGVELELLDTTALASFELRNLPGEILVEYNALTDNGQRLLVTRPRDGWSYEDFRLFYGENDALTERVVVDVTRAKDGGTTHIRFVLNGAEATALFPASVTGTPAPPSLTVGADVLPLTKLAASDALESLTFTCLEPEG